ncbi:MAG: hypothetical protein EAX91_03460 [Candidatus Lokiarchaeota archaeon]|nr:hypothetical protein [Candidatus Lokiarchaeota archaeon]
METLMNLLIKGLEQVGYQISDAFYDDEFGMVDCEFKIKKNSNRYYLKIVNNSKPEQGPKLLVKDTQVSLIEDIENVLGQNEYSVIKYGATFDMETTLEIGKENNYFKLYIGDIGRNKPNY